MKANVYCKNVFDGTHDTPKPIDGSGYPLITSKHIDSGRLLLENAYSISKEDYLKINQRSQVRQWDVLFTMIGTVGDVYLEKSDNVGYAIKNIGVFSCQDENKAKWLYYFLQSPLAKRRTQNFLAGAVQKFVPLQFLRQFDIPALTEERTAIALFLELLDRKLSINRQINHNLREQVRTLCRAWLVDYIPFGGVIPRNWHVVSLSSIAKFVNGYSYKKAELTSSNTAMATIKNFDRNGGFKLDGYKEIVPSSGKLKSEHYVSNFDLLVAHTDLTRLAGILGNAELVLSFSGHSKVLFSTDIVKVTPRPGVSKFLIASLFQDGRFKNHALGYASGTTVLHLGKKALPDFKVTLPKNLEEMSPLVDTLEAMYKKIAANVSESEKLLALKDFLLPRFMSGEISVSNAK